MDVPSPAEREPDLAEALARLEQLTSRMLGLEREVLDLQAFRRRVQDELSRARAPRGSLEGATSEERARLAAENERLRQELEELRSKLGRHVDREPELQALRAELEAARGEAQRTSEAGTGLESARKDLEGARSEVKKLLAENERLEGELQALNLRHEDLKSRTQTATRKLSDLKLDLKDEKAEEALRALVLERDQLLDERSKLDAELTRIKGEAAKRFTKMKGELDKANQDAATMRMHKENLLQQLAARDAAGPTSAKPELTLEEITNSEVFKNMLGNIRRTSRQEVTILHDAVAQMRSIDPKAYSLALELVAKGFQKASMENPLAMLPKP